jgi:hypothetical protein
MPARTPTTDTAYPGLAQLEPPPHVLRLFEHVLRPLARLAVSQGVRLGWLVECLKRLLVEEAAAVAAPDAAKELPLSTVAMLTGVHRTDVKRLRGEAGTSVSDDAAGPSIPSRVLAEWTGHASTLDANGWPLPLPRLASVGGERSFEALVRRAYGAVTPRAVLDALLQDGTVRLDDDDVVHCLSVVSGGPNRDSNVAERWRANAEILHDDIAWLAASARPGPKEQSTRWTVSKPRLTRASVDLAKDWYEREGMALAQRFNAMVTQLADADRRRKTAVWRLRMSTSFFFTPADG